MVSISLEYVILRRHWAKWFSRKNSLKCDIYSEISINSFKTFKTSSRSGIIESHVKKIVNILESKQQTLFTKQSLKHLRNLQTKTVTFFKPRERFWPRINFTGFPWS